MSYVWNAFDMLANQVGREFAVAIIAFAIFGILYWVLSGRR
jgi:hypothetical protein